MLSRRGFIAHLGALGAAIAAARWSLPERVCAQTPSARGAVVSIHMDQPYIDVTGRALPYLPPAGARAAAPVAGLSETEFRRRFVYL